MNEQGLKALENLGAELGAAKAENEKLRGLLTKALEFTEANTCGGPDVAQLIAEMRVALYRQAEPTDTFTAVDMATAAAQGFRDGQAAVEPAPAQDDQYPPCDYCGVIPDHHPWHGSGMFNGEDSPHIHACNDCRHLLPTRPAQTEQQPVGRVLTYEESLRSDGKSGPAFWFGPLPAGAFLYAAPIAQTAPNSDCEWCAGAGKDHFGGKCEHCQTAPQPEQSGLAEALEELLAGTGTSPGANKRYGKARAALDAYRAALSAQGAGDASA